MHLRELRNAVLVEPEELEWLAQLRPVSVDPPPRAGHELGVLVRERGDGDHEWVRGRPAVGVSVNTRA